MLSVAYYLPNIPDIPSTTRYNHALAIPNLADHSLLITYPNDPPTRIVDGYDTVRVLKTGPVRDRAREAKKAATGFLTESHVQESVFLTSFHYAPALAGWLSDEFWTVDIYDDPNQLRYHDPFSLHQIGVRGLIRLLHRANRAVHTVHPSTPHTFGRNQFFAVNGADVTNIDPGPRTDTAGPLKAVCAGVKDGVDVLLRALALSNVDIDVDIFGSVPSDGRALLADLELENRVSLHGSCEHPRVVKAIRAADVGFCLFPDKTDWYYAHPIKIGEYLAGGTIPIASAYPGIRQLTRDSGMLVEYDSDAVSEALTELYERPELRDRLKTRCRQRAEAIDWHDEREWFAKQALYGNKAGKH